MAKFPEETRIYNDCFTSGAFGKHRFSISTRGFGKRWSKPSPEPGLSITNKYVFSQDFVQGKQVYFFSKSFEMPWKISEIIFLASEKYCFVNAPEFIEEEISGLRLQNINLDNCSFQDIKVCFGFNECDVKVRGSCFDYECESEYDYGFVEKDNKKVSYVGSLIYGAIFSSREIYECNVKRLMKRLRQQALLYKDEANFIEKCDFPVSGLLKLVSVSSGDLLLVREVAREVDEQNSVAECKLW